jgi:hypothetical protein
LTYPVDPRVDAYIDALPDWQQAICREIRDLVHAADPAIVETIKRTRQPYFVLEGNVCALLAAKDHVNVFLYDGGIVPDPEGIITGGQNNTTARTVAVHKGETINASALTAMFRQIIANNRAGGWRKVERERSVAMRVLRGHELVLIWQRNPRPPIIHISGDCPSLSRSAIPHSSVSFTGLGTAGWMQLDEAIRLVGPRFCKRCM